MFSVLFLALICGLPSETDTKIVSGEVSTPYIQNWVFLTRFCFLSKTGRLEFEFWYPKSHDEGYNAAQNILLYHDNQWPSVYSDNKQALLPSKDIDPNNPDYMSCEERESVLLPENNQVINLTIRYRWSGCSIVSHGNEEWYKCVGGRTFASTRERWWFIVLSNCATTKGLKLQYNITMTNDLTGDIFFEQFSADEFYIFQITIVFLLVYGLLLMLSLYVAYSLHIRQLYHTTYKLYMASMCIEFLALVAQIIYWADYAQTGVPQTGWKNLGRFLEFSGQCLFLILLILMGKGFTITRGRISTGGVIKIIVFSIFFIALTITMFIWEVVSFDPGLVLYLYDSVPGYALIAVKIASWLWFLYAIFFTLKHYPEKLSFYIPFIILYTIWFWFGISVALAGIERIPRWMKEKVVQGCMLFFTFIGHLVFLILTWPTMANKTFPYHIKTTQVGAMELSPSQQQTSTTGGSNVASGGAYGPTDNGTSLNEPIGERAFIDMFTTQHTHTSPPAYGSKG